jgi:hypothetical protein
MVPENQYSKITPEHCWLTAKSFNIPAMPE